MGVSKIQEGPYCKDTHATTSSNAQMGWKMGSERRAYFSAPFFFFWRPSVLAQEREKERKKRGDAYVERAGPQAPKGMLGCNTLKP